jgi:succinoglycan biosynthesis protein ExoU
LTDGHVWKCMTGSDPSTDELAMVRGRSDSTAPCVDVLIAARDRADTIERAVQSALAQPEVCTVIVVDDGSSDDTAMRAGQCGGGERLIIKRLSSNVGPSAARNIGMEIARSPWLAILDGDDYFLPGRIRTLLSSSEGWDLIADGLLQVSEEDLDCELPRQAEFLESFAPRAISLTRFVRGNVARRGRLRQELGFVKPLIRRSFLLKHALRYDETLRLGEDYALYTRALVAGGRFLLIPAAGYVSLVRANSLSGRHSKQDLERLRDSDLELMSMGTLTARERRAVAAHYSSVDCRVQWLTVIEAFKSRRVFDFLRPFVRSPTIALYITARLLEEFWGRSLRVIAGHALD